MASLNPSMMGALFNDKGDQIPVKRKLQTVATLPEADELIAKGYDNICIDPDGRRLGDKGALLLVRLLQERPRLLRRLQIDDQNIGDKGADPLFKQLANDRTLTSLEMTKNSFGPQSMRSLYDMMSVNKTLTYLDLSKNKSIKETGGKLIAAIIKVSTTLRVLCMNNCNVPVEGMVSIGQALAENSHLVSLSAGGNANSNVVADAFGASLKQNTKLRSLVLYGGSKKIGSAGFKSICAGLKENKVFQKLYVSKSNIKDDAMNDLAKLLAVNKSLKSIDLMKNPGIGPKGYLALIEGMQGNTTLTALHLKHSINDAWRILMEVVGANAARHGELARRTFEDVLKDPTAKGPMNTTKLMFIGQGKAGKTATVRAFLGEEFEPEWKSTIAASVSVAKVSNAIGWSVIEGKKKYKIATDFAANIALKDVDDHEKRVIEEVRQEGEGTTIVEGSNLQGDIEIQARVGETSKLENMKTAHPVEVETENGVPIAPAKGYFEHKTDYYETLFEEAEKEKNSLRFTIWDFGGQRIFYSLHHLFMSKYGVYIMVFSLQEMLDQPKRGQAYMRFWLNSLSLHAPDTPLFLLGSFWDKVQGQNDLQTINEIVAQVLTKYPFNVCENKEGELLFFPISNLNGKGVGAAKGEIYKVAKKQEHVNIQVPLSWIYIIEHLLVKRKKPYITMKSMKEKAVEFKIDPNNELYEMLETFNKYGMVLHLTQTVSLSDIITLKPHWLVKSFGRIIRDGELHKHDEKYIKRDGLEEDVKYLFQQGLVSEDFMLLVWKEREIDYLIDMMKQTLMMCDWTFKDSAVTGADKIFYFVPALVTGSKDLDSEELDDKATIPKETFLQDNIDILSQMCWFQFSFLPDGVFDRLICLCVGHSNLLNVAKPPTIEQHKVEITFADDVAIRFYEKREYEAIILELVDTNATKAQSALNIISSMLKKLKVDIIGDGLAWDVMFPKSPTEFISYEDAVNEALKPWFTNGKQENTKLDAVATEHIDVNKFLEGLNDF